MTYTVHRVLDLHHRAGAEAERTFDTARAAAEFIAGPWRSEWTYITDADGQQITAAELYIASVDERDAQYRAHHAEREAELDR